MAIKLVSLASFEIGVTYTSYGEEITSFLFIAQEFQGYITASTQRTLPVDCSLSCQLCVVSDMIF